MINNKSSKIDKVTSGAEERDSDERNADTHAWLPQLLRGIFRFSR